jgi:hypothetical protein
MTANTYRVRLSKPVTDYLRADVIVRAATPDDAKRFALAQIAADPARYDGAWTFSQCGDSGEVYAFDASLIADEEDVTA